MDTLLYKNIDIEIGKQCF